jgi:TRAP-type C4-dicarboxylate transport system substrate-binding protein
MFAKRLAIVTALLLLVAVVPGCSGQDKTQPAAKPQQVIELKLAHTNPPESIPGKALVEFADEVAKKSDGRLKVTVFGGETLCKGTDTYAAVINGLADLAWNTATQSAGMLPVSQLTTLPMLPIPDPIIGGKAFRELFETTDYLKNEYKDVHVLGLEAVGGFGTVIGTNNKLIKTLEDLKGMRIRVSPGANTDFMKAVGAQPVNIPVPEMWEAMDKKTVDGYMFSFTAVYDFKLFDVTKYWTEIKTYAPAMWFAMNKAKYESLPDDLKKVIDDCGKETIEKLDQEFYNKIKSCIASTKRKV